MVKPSLGDQELELLRYVVEQGPVTVGEAVEGFGGRHGWARSTVVTVMERLRKKGYLARRKQEGVYRYASPVAREEFLGGLVRDFVQKTLAGSLTPFLAYLAESPEVTEAELRELQQTVEKMRLQREEKAE